MIYFPLKKEPDNFNSRVREPGNLWIKDNPEKVAEKKFSPFWRYCRDDLYDSYNGICAYYCIYILKVNYEVDHFFPKSDPQYHRLVYEWENYRVSCNGINRKKNNKIVIDPCSLNHFSAQPVFVINFLSGKVQANPRLTPEEIHRVNETIKILDLNQSCLCEKRSTDLDDLINGNTSLKRLERESPFVRKEITRQKID